MKICIGDEIELGWNGAKSLAGRGVLSGEVVRIEAIGRDWVVVRDCEGRAYAAAFTRGEIHEAGGLKKLLEG